jgi:hypothetical protein
MYVVKQQFAPGGGKDEMGSDIPPSLSWFPLSFISSPLLSPSLFHHTYSTRVAVGDVVLSRSYREPEKGNYVVKRVLGVGGESIIVPGEIFMLAKPYMLRADVFSHD